jgi:hypothetical protein
MNKYEAFKGDEILVPLQYVIDVHDCFTYLVERSLINGESSALEIIKESKALLEGGNDETK